MRSPSSPRHHETLDALLQLFLPEVPPRWLRRRLHGELFPNDAGSRSSLDLVSHLDAEASRAAGKPFLELTPVEKERLVGELLAGRSDPSDLARRLLSAAKRAYYHSPRGWRSVGQSGPLFAAYWPEALHGPLVSLVRLRSRLYARWGGFFRSRGPSCHD